MKKILFSLAALAALSMVAVGCKKASDAAKAQPEMKEITAVKTAFTELVKKCKDAEDPSNTGDCKTKALAQEVEKSFKYFEQKVGVFANKKVTRNGQQKNVDVDQLKESLHIGTTTNDIKTLCTLGENDNGIWNTKDLSSSSGSADGKCVTGKLKSLEEALKKIEKTVTGLTETTLPVKS